jgi:hypothetical protein
MSAIKDNSVLCSGIKRKIKLMVLMRKGIRLKQGESTMLRKYLGTVDVNCELDKTGEPSWEDRRAAEGRLKS